VHTEHQDGYRYQYSDPKNNEKTIPKKKKVQYKGSKKLAYAKATLAYKAALERIEREYRDNDDDEVQEIETGMESDDEMYEE
jgi:hypothetical protein